MAVIIQLIVSSLFIAWVCSPPSLVIKGSILLFKVYYASNKERKTYRGWFYFIAYKSFPMITAQRLKVALLGMAIFLFVLLAFLGVVVLDQSILKAVFIVLFGSYFIWYTLWMRQQIEPFDRRIARLYAD